MLLSLLSAAYGTQTKNEGASNRSGIAGALERLESRGPIRVTTSESGGADENDEPESREGEHPHNQ